MSRSRLCGTWKANEGAAEPSVMRYFARKTGRRLTSDPIRTSLGLLPSGPDPVGEWLLPPPSPRPYLGPKASESKRGIWLFAGLVRKRGKALVAVMPGLVLGIHVFLWCRNKSK